MSTVYTPPSTIEGIKRLAKKISREQNIPYTKAQDHASREAGYQNFVHAKRAITRQTGHRIYLSAYWRETSGAPRLAGRETLEISLPVSLAELTANHHLRGARNLESFLQEFADHLEIELDSYSQVRAHHHLLAAARTLQFMAATSLHPLTKSAQRRKADITNDLPLSDHRSYWGDPITGEWLVIDEPYGHAEEKAEARASWAKREHVHLTTPKWGGLYLPWQTSPTLISPNMQLLQRIQRAVEALELQPQDDPALESASYFTDFVSPLRIAANKSRKRRAGATYRRYAGAVTYGGMPGVPSLWRPEAPMPQESHARLGQLLQDLHVSGLPVRAWDHISNMRSTLEDWSYIEYPVRRDAPDEWYYCGSTTPIKGRANICMAITEASALVSSGYQECAPRRKLLKQLASIERSVIRSAAKHLAT